MTQNDKKLHTQSCLIPMLNNKTLCHINTYMLFWTQATSHVAATSVQIIARFDRVYKLAKHDWQPATKPVYVPRSALCHIWILSVCRWQATRIFCGNPGDLENNTPGKSQIKNPILYTNCKEEKNNRKTSKNSTNTSRNFKLRPDPFQNKAVQ